MVTVSLDEARADIAGLLDRVEQGEDVLITRGTVAAPKPDDHVSMHEALEELARFRDGQPPWSAPSADLLRDLREERY